MSKSEKKTGRQSNNKTLAARILVIVLALATILGFVILPIGLHSFAEGASIVIDNFETGKLSESINEAAEDIDLNNVENIAVLSGTLNADDYATIASYPNIVNVELAKCKTEDGKIPEDALKSKNRLQYISLPENTTEICANAFYGNASLVKVSMPACTALIGDYAFCNCIKLSDIKFNTDLTIGKGAFSGCQSLSEVSVVLNSDTIAEDAFSKCSISEVFFGPKTKTISENAFADCQKLKNVYFYGDTAPQIGNDAFKNDNLTIHHKKDATGFDDIKLSNITTADDFNDEFKEPVTTEVTEETAVTEETKEQSETTAQSETTEQQSTEQDNEQAESVSSSDITLTPFIIILIVVISVIAGAAIVVIIVLIKIIRSKSK